jgi:hypothetical protein
VVVPILSYLTRSTRPLASIGTLISLQLLQPSAVAHNICAWRGLIWKRCQKFDEVMIGISKENRSCGASIQ